MKCQAISLRSVVESGIAAHTMAAKGNGTRCWQKRTNAHEITD
jgi:hypothetical protein